ncbi:MAG: MBL fold metallo-hydrolase [Deltaproteobacteria bacterium]|nr:MBL fold metallo-hydrolase [Deltaproteobacteria bacterium]
MGSGKDNSVITIDCHYLKPRFAAAFLLIENGRAIFIENNTSHALPHLLNSLDSQKIARENVDYLIVTHAHLDHAGGTSTLLQHCPNARVLAHPKAAKTLSNPDRLIQSARKVYGDETFTKLYGEVAPIPQSKIRAVQDGEILNWGTRALNFFYTLGHASHHVCIYDSKSAGVFTGDAFGLCYPDLQARGLFIFPSTSPIDYDPVEAKNSVKKILSFHPKRLFLTHFGEVSDVAGAYTNFVNNLDIHEAQFRWAKEHLELGPKLASQIQENLKKTYGFHQDYLSLDIELNAKGIAYTAAKL